MANPALTVWGKTNDDHGRPMAAVDREWLPLAQHLRDSGAAISHLWDDWLSQGLRDLIGASFGGQENGRRVARFLAAVHDIGKATPAFALQARPRYGELLDRMAAAGLRIHPGLPPAAARELRHALAGHVILHDWLVEQGWSSEAADQLAVIVGGHHGIPPEFTDINHVLSKDLHFGGEAWRTTRRALLDRAALGSQTTDLWPTWRSLRIPQPTQVALSGLVIMADWIASNTDLFPLLALDQIDCSHSANDRAQHAFERLGLPTAWRPQPGSGTADDHLKRRFDIIGGARPVQAAALAAARTMDLPGLMIVEAAMGEGKTEAALLAAETLAHRSKTSGCFIGLPTQATTDAMFSRMLGWLEQLPDGGPNSPHSVVLAHGKSWLNTSYRDLFSLGKPGSVGIDEREESTGDGARHDCEVQAYVEQWTTGRKKGALADFVVGTVDQLLFMALKSRHLALRHLGLARKVVIIDEVHAYDAYMNVYLERSLEWLGAYGVPVILLSATLPPQRRLGLCAAYQRGLARRVVTPPVEIDWTQSLGGWGEAGTASADADSSTSPPIDDASAPYPLISLATQEEVTSLPVTASDARRTEVSIHVLDDDLDTLVATLREQLDGGGCALVVRNTVHRAQEAATRLRQEFAADGTEVRLAHARFMGHHRVANDDWLRTRFGAPASAATRPQRAIVIGTQVVEQSLDIDFDVLITDLAPVDLVLQRIGRLHRHRRGNGEADRPPRLRIARCMVTGVANWHAEPPEVAPDSSRIYARSLLLRSAWPIIQAHRAALPWVLPTDIPRHVRDVYADEPRTPGPWQAATLAADVDLLNATDERRRKARSYLLAEPDKPGEPILGWVHAGIGEADEHLGRAAVRDGDDSLEALLLRRHHDGTLRLPEGNFDGANEIIEIDTRPNPRQARALAGCSLRLPAWVSNGELGSRVLNALQQNWFPAWQQDPILRGQLILCLDDAFPTDVAGMLFTYDRTTGLEVRRNAD